MPKTKARKFLFSLELVFMKLFAELAKIALNNNLKSELAYNGFCVGRDHKLFVCRKNVYLYL